MNSEFQILNFRIQKPDAALCSELNSLQLKQVTGAQGSTVNTINTVNTIFSTVYYIFH